MMEHNNPNITKPRWMIDSQRADFNQAARNLSDSQRAETLANEHVKELNRLARLYLSDEAQATLKDCLADLMGDTFSAYKGNE